MLHTPHDMRVCCRTCAEAQVVTNINKAVHSQLLRL
jgi:hypothetical protein